MSVAIETIKQTIYKYYPKNLEWGSKEYLTSSEFINYNKQCEALKNTDLKDTLLYAMKNVVGNYAIMDWTNFELYNDIEFKILLHEGIDYMDDDIELLKMLNYNKKELIIFISLIDKYYYIMCVNTRFKNNEYYFSIVENIPENFIVRESLNKLFDKLNYKEITNETAKIILPDLSTELKNFSEVTIFDCLFNDMTTL